MKKTFKEEQKFKAFWIWTIMLLVIGTVGFGFYKEWQASEMLSIWDMNFSTALISILFTIALCILFFRIKLKTEVNHEGIQITYKPFINKMIYWNEIEKSEVLDYGFVGGWGFRFSMKYGTVYNTQGKMGLALQLKTGKKLLVGTQRPEELKAVLDQYYIS
jgi:hypothetical protein